VAALQQKVQAARAEKARLAAEAEEKRLEEERLREEEKKKEAEETRKRLAAAAAAKASSSGPSVSDCFVVCCQFYSYLEVVGAVYSTPKTPIDPSSFLYRFTSVSTSYI
jgi:single-stranded DNA-specific DHH superfamily exonuclease